MFDAKQLLDLLAGGRLGPGAHAAAANVNEAVERGKLWILQTRSAKRSGEAAVKDGNPP